MSRRQRTRVLGLFSSSPDLVLYKRIDEGVGARSVTTIDEVSSTASILGASTVFQ